MVRTRTRRRSSRRQIATSLGKPRGVLHPRVQQVGPEHFGIVCFDCAKVRSKYLLADFYGRTYASRPRRGRRAPSPCF